MRRSITMARRENAPALTRAQLVEAAKAHGAPNICVNWSIKALKRWAEGGKS